MDKRLGRIKSAQFGIGGYQDSMIGVAFVLEGTAWGVSDFWGDWAQDPTPTSQWTKEDRLVNLGNTCLRLRDLLRAAKKSTVSDLVGVPIEGMFEGNRLESWRVLTEVL